MKPTVTQALVAVNNAVWWVVAVIVISSLAIRGDAYLRAFVEGR